MELSLDGNAEAVADRTDGKSAHETDQTPPRLVAVEMEGEGGRQRACENSGNWGDKGAQEGESRSGETR